MPNALMIGVPYDVFWDLTPASISPFVKAFALKQKYDDAVAWQHGLYIKVAIVSAMDKNTKYPTTPFSNSKEVTMTAEDRQKLIKERFMRHAQQINTKFGKENEIV